jgi:nucleoside-diphosphate-sugar epimerase
MLVEQGNEVVGIDSMNDAYDPRLKHHRIERQGNIAGLEFVEGDIEDQDFLGKIFQEHRFDSVLNLAARAGVRYSMENPTVYLQTNAQGTLNIMEEMRKGEISKLVLASTSSLYAGHELPFSEEMPVNGPISPYAASKKAAEAMAHSYHYLYGIDVSVVRYFTVYGPAGRPDMCIFRFIKWIDEGVPLEILGDGEQSRDFTFVDDIARGTILAQRPLGFEVINLGGGMTPVSLLDVISRLEKLLNKKAELNFVAVNPADIKEARAEVGKAERLLDWKPQVSLDEGLAACVDWYLENRDWVKDVQL